MLPQLFPNHVVGLPGIYFIAVHATIVCGLEAANKEISVFSIFENKKKDTTTTSSHF